MTLFNIVRSPAGNRAHGKGNTLTGGVQVGETESRGAGKVFVICCNLFVGDLLDFKGRERW